jgi:hypothetical protein
MKRYFTKCAIVNPANIVANSYLMHMKIKSIIRASGTYPSDNNSAAYYQIEQKIVNLHKLDTDTEFIHYSLGVIGSFYAKYKRDHQKATYWLTKFMSHFNIYDPTYKAAKTMLDQLSLPR